MTDNEKLKKLKKLADAMYYAAQQLTTDASRLHKAMYEYHKFIIHEWREEPVSEVWHYQKKEPVDEIADKSRPIIVVYGNNSLNAAGKFRYYEDNSDAIWLSNSYEKWAFVEDLINLTHLVNKTSDQEEPVSEDLEEAIGQSFIYHENRGDDFRSDKQIETAYRQGFETGANWKEQQFEKNRLKHCNSITNEQAELEQGFIDQHLDKYQRMPTFLDAVEYGMRLQKEQMMKDAVDGWVFRDIKEGKLRISDNKECWNGIRIPEKSIEKSYLFCTTDDAIKVKLVIVKED